MHWTLLLRLQTMVRLMRKQLREGCSVLQADFYFVVDGIDDWIALK
jgi:hypothetical protein